MKTLALLAVSAMLLLDVFGPKSSVGGPMSDIAILFVTMLSVGIYQAWSRQRGAPGWIVSIVAAVIGGFIAVDISGMAIEEILTRIQFQGSLAVSHHPMRYISSICLAIFAVLGSWSTIQIVNGIGSRLLARPCKMS